jgi:hypothetical protein
MHVPFLAASSHVDSKCTTTAAESESSARISRGCPTVTDRMYLSDIILIILMAFYSRPTVHHPLSPVHYVLHDESGKYVQINTVDVGG